MKDNKIFIVNAFYDMNIGEDEEIITEVYASKEMADERCKKLIKDWKENGYTKDDADEWDEGESSLWAFSDSRWNVSINVTESEIKG